MSNVTMSDGAVLVTIEEVKQEPRSMPVATQTPMPSVDGSLVVYTEHSQLEEVGISGRVRTMAEIQKLEEWAENQTVISWTHRSGDITTNWRMRTGGPALNFRRKDGDSPDYLVDFRLWRLP